MTPGPCAEGNPTPAAYNAHSRAIYRTPLTPGGRRRDATGIWREARARDRADTAATAQSMENCRGVDITAMIREMQEQDLAEQARLAVHREWGRRFLRLSGADPDDQATVKSLFDRARASWGQTIWDVPGHLDGGSYYALVDAISCAFGWVHWPLDWGAVHLYRADAPFKNTLTRTGPAAVEGTSL